MADFKISELVEASQANSSDFIIINKKNESTKRINASSLVSSYGDGAYIKTDEAAGDQTVLSTGTTTFAGLTSHGGGVKVTGGDANNVERGVYSPDVNTIGFALQHQNGTGSNPFLVQVDETYLGRVRLGEDNGINITTSGTTITTTPENKNAVSEDASIVSINTRITDALATKLNGYNLVGFNMTLGLEDFRNTPYQEVNFFKTNDFFPNRDNVYSYLSDITVGTGSNRFNFYSRGNAPNYFNGEVRGGGTDGENFNWIISPDGSTSPFKIQLQMQSDEPTAFQTTYSTDEEGNQVENKRYIGESESLLAIIKDLRARVEALEAAATS